jgi:hypothetical protein
MHHNITHIHEIHNVGYDIVYVNVNTSSQQAKQLLWRCVIVTGSSHHVEQAIDKVISLPATSL